MSHESQAGVKIAGRNSSLRYADDTTLMVSEEELKSHLMRVKRTVKSCLKTQHSKTKIVTFSSITSWQIEVETMETVSDFIFLGCEITADGDCSHEIK